MSNGIAGIYAATITVVDRRKGYFALDATVPDLGNYDIRFIRWDESQGNTPAVGTSGMAEMVPTSRQKRFLPGGNQHKFDSPELDGSEWASEVEWSMVSFAAEGATAPATPKAPATAAKPSGGQSGNRSAGLLSAQDRWIADHRMKNSRDSIWMAIENAKAAPAELRGDYTDMNGLISDLIMSAFIIRDELNSALDEATGLIGPESDSTVCPPVPESELVKAAVEMGAKVVDVVDAPASPDKPTASNAADVRAYVLKRQDEGGGVGWGRDYVVAVFVAAGFKTLDDYIAAPGHTAQGALDVLREKLDW